LGTYVTVSLSDSGTGAHRAAAFGAAFARIEEISALMSFHDPKSELSRLNSTPVGEWIEVSPELSEVLRAALRLYKKSGGRYNIGVGSALVRNGVLPGARRRVSWSHLRSAPAQVRDGRARRLRPLQLDLGGIAKGYAVDCAVSELKRRGCSGVVNAGGDLRVFGSTQQEIWIRTPSGLRPLLLKNRAAATSSVSRGSYIDIPGKRAIGRKRTALVLARDCMTADALTKVALLAPAHVTSSLALQAGAEVALL
jgi:thiamine biosynthesis lipoprotein